MYVLLVIANSSSISYFVLTKEVHSSNISEISFLTIGSGN